MNQELSCSNIWQDRDRQKQNNDLLQGPATTFVQKVLGLNFVRAAFGAGLQ